MVVFECAFLLSTSLGSDALLEWAEPAAAERLLDWKVSHGAAPRQYHLHFLSSHTSLLPKPGQARPRQCGVVRLGVALPLCVHVKKHAAGGQRWQQVPLGAGATQ